MGVPDFFEEFVFSIISIFRTIWFMVLVSFFITASLFVGFRIYQRKRFPIHILDNLGDLIEPTVQKGATVLVFTGFCIFGGNQLDKPLRTGIIFSCLFGVAGVIAGAIFWKMWRDEN